MCHRTCVINKTLVVGQVRVARWVARAVHLLFPQPSVVDAVDLEAATLRQVSAAVAAVDGADSAVAVAGTTAARAATMASVHGGTTSTLLAQ